MELYLRDDSQSVTNELLKKMKPHKSTFLKFLGMNVCDQEAATSAMLARIVRPTQPRPRLLQRHSFSH